jgi:hypothetical protein
MVFLQAVPYWYRIENTAVSIPRLYFCTGTGRTTKSGNYDIIYAMCAKILCSMFS